MVGSDMFKITLICCVVDAHTCYGYIRTTIAISSKRNGIHAWFDSNLVLSDYDGGDTM